MDIYSFGPTVANRIPGVDRKHVAPRTSKRPEGTCQLEIRSCLLREKAKLRPTQTSIQISICYLSRSLAVLKFGKGKGTSMSASW